MFRQSNLKSVLIVMTLFLGVYFTLPSIIGQEAMRTVAGYLPSFLVPKNAIKLGLDLQGGVHVMLEADRPGVTRDLVRQLQEDVRGVLRTERVPPTGGIVAQNTGVSLRNLGAQRTLVLLNGRRLGISTSGFADVSTIPAVAVERIEVLKDGASSIYGSDAIAGVINVITRSNYEGAAASAYFGQYSEGDGDITKGDFVIGFTGDRGSITAAAEWAEEDQVAASARPYSAFPRSSFHPTDNWTPVGQFGGFVTTATTPVPGLPAGTRVVLRDGGNPRVITDYIRQDLNTGTCVGATDTICDDVETAVEPAISGCFGFIGGDEVLVMASHYPGICTPCGR